MNLIEAKNKVTAKNKTKQQLVGKKQILMESLKELGFKSVVTAQSAGEVIGKDIVKMKKHYDTGENKFKEKYAHLLI